LMVDNVRDVRSLPRVEPSPTQPPDKSFQHVSVMCTIVQLWSPTRSVMHMAWRPIELVRS